MYFISPTIVDLFPETSIWFIGAYYHFAIIENDSSCNVITVDPKSVWDNGPTQYKAGSTDAFPATTNYILY